MYETGAGVPRDNVLAYVWMNLAASQRDDEAKKHRENLERMMTAAQTAEAQRLAREWKPKQ